MNMSHAAVRLEDISFYLNDSYLEGFYFPKDSTTTEIKFTTIEILSKNLYEREGLPFEVGYDIVMKQAAKDLLPKTILLAFC